MIEILIAATPRDLRWARICLASIRHFHPDSPVRFLPGAPLPASFLRETSEHFNAGVFPTKNREFGWGFVKLEPLFQEEPGLRFLILDADTILTGPILNIFENCSAPFLVDDEKQTNSETKRLYYDFEMLEPVDPRALRPAFVFNSGQWFGTSDVLVREDFDRWIEWEYPRRLKHPDIFMSGDQGVFNYVLNQKHQLDGLPVNRQRLMRWPGHGNLDDITPDTLEKFDPRVVHWAGFKAARIETLPRADLLLHFEREYYRRISGGEGLRLSRALQAQTSFHHRSVATRISQRMQRWLGKQ